ncbi:MAG: 2-oxo acid dehydrogenase subunit E2 [Myxococcales bacterium]|nr:2-oxo acid dehydrogenase subunit E2 [Myxococcales bacterium]
MSFKFHLPDLAEGMTEAEVVDWKVAVGDSVALDQPIVEVMSDKATVEIPSPKAGTVEALNYGPGDMCSVGEVLFVINEGGASVAPATASAVAEFEDTAAGATTTVFNAADVAVAVAAGATSAKSSSAGKPVVIDATSGRTRVLATPATRRVARQVDIDIAQVPGSGPHGRVTTDDLKNFQKNRAPSAAAAAQPAPLLARKPVAIATDGEEERIPFRGMRKRIADNMARSVFTAAHFTYVEEVDTNDLVEVHARAKARGEERGVKLTYLPFIIKAVVAGLKKHPSLNSSLDESTTEIVRKNYYHIGVATQGPQGLTVTVVRNADKLSIFEIAAEVTRLAKAVQDGTATREDLSNSTFTISSLGKLGGLMATPIINFPEAGILGVHKMEQRPAVRDGELCIRWKMNLAISLDHRLVDGYDGAIFVQDVKALLEDPTMMFMEMV